MVCSFVFVLDILTIAKLFMRNQEAAVVFFLWLELLVNELETSMLVLIFVAAHVSVNTRDICLPFYLIVHSDTAFCGTIPLKCLNDPSCHLTSLFEVSAMKNFAA
ncbi:hypothetical protein NE237_029215 [Protea cynaroides]|uniref:Uncharacterized protein n=1 Tax=Protea cynaroides TaxID=273540 RepID=A0A9Q0JW26_9MAGN|nr:hypothetical protein NE237_029215 [Protea cynaroides]